MAGEHHDVAHRHGAAIGVATLIAAALAWLVIAASAAGSPTPPLPGGKYVGETTKGSTLKVKVKAASTEAVMRGRVILPCSRKAARFRSDDGRFVAKRTNRRGKVLLKVRGRFVRMQKARGKVERVRMSGRKRGKRRGRCTPARFSAELANSAPITMKTVRYGPFHTEPTGGHGGGHNVGLGDLEKPCEDCYLVGMLPNLVSPDGSTANFDTMAMLHHAVFFNQDAADATCGGWPERFFASGNERSPFVMPRGYGYRVNAGDRWSLLTHLMNMEAEAKDLFIEVTFFYVDGPADLEAVTPFWLDINNCGNSEYATPTGAHTETRDFTVPPAMAGKIVAIGGHLHDHGDWIRLTNTSRGERICEGQAGYGADPTYMGHIEHVGGCTGRPLATVDAGETVRLLSHYEAPEPLGDVMGIMVGYVAPNS